MLTDVLDIFEMLGIKPGAVGITLDDLKESNNTITGSVKLLTTIENKEYELNGKFEFKYVEDNEYKLGQPEVLFQRIDKDKFLQDM